MAETVLALFEEAAARAPKGDDGPPVPRVTVPDAGEALRRGVWIGGPGKAIRWRRRGIVRRDVRRHDPAKPLTRISCFTSFAP